MKKIKVFIVVLVVMLISVIAFFGVYKLENGVWQNLVADYEYGMDLEGARELKYALDASEEEKYVYVDENGNVMGEVWKDGSPITAEDEGSSEEGQAEEVSYAKETRTIKVNPDEKLTKENFEQAKKIIQNRLKSQGVGEYNIRIDDVTGALAIETANDNEQVSLVESLVDQAGKFEIIDYQNGVKLMDNSDIKNVSASSAGQSGYQASLIIEFDKEGAEKLKEISNKYVQTVTQTEPDEGEEPAEETTTKYISVVLDGTTMMTTYFGEEMSNGALVIALGDEQPAYADVVEDLEVAQTIADILNSGELPVNYQLETDNFVKAAVNVDDIKIAAAVVILVVSIILIIKFKAKGILAAILGIGYVAVLSLVLRYTNVTLTVNSLIAYVIVVLMNYVFINMFMQKLKEESVGQAYNETTKKFYLTIIPVIVMAVIFTLTTYASINSIGMVMFWGLLLIAIYNFIFTRTKGLY